MSVPSLPICPYTCSPKEENREAHATISLTPLSHIAPQSLFSLDQTTNKQVGRWGRCVGRVVRWNRGTGSSLSEIGLWASSPYHLLHFLPLPFAFLPACLLLLHTTFLSLSQWPSHTIWARKEEGRGRDERNGMAGGRRGRDRDRAGQGRAGGKTHYWLSLFCHYLPHQWCCCLHCHHLPPLSPLI